MCYRFNMLLRSYAVDLQVLCYDLWLDLLPHEAH